MEWNVEFCISLFKGRGEALVFGQMCRHLSDKRDA